MKTRLIALILAPGAALPTLLPAQLGSFGDIPVEITADGETRFEGGVAVAEENVVIKYGDTHIFCDLAQYNPETREVLLLGQVRIYRDACCNPADRYDITSTAGVPSNVTSYVDPNAPSGTHRYWVTAVGPGINESQPSNSFDWLVP